MKSKNFTNEVLGYVVPNAIAFVLIGIERLVLTDVQGGAGTFIFSEFVVLPVLMGIIGAWFWRDLGLGGWGLFGYSCLNTLLAVGLSAVFLHEGAICLLIVSPLIMVFVAIGAFIGRAMFKKNNGKLNISIVSLLMLIAVVDSLSKHEYQNEVSDTIVIRATPDRIWKNVVAFEPIKQKSDYFLFRIGLPTPMATTVTGYYKGAGRKCIFSNGYTFGERMSTYKPGKDLTFDIVYQPRDPEIMNHLDLLKGQFLLKDNGDGTTTLTGNSWYKLYVFPTWYYDIWTQSIVRNVHIRVMEHIKEFSEKK
jgi:hypothetical protein